MEDIYYSFDNEFNKIRTAKKLEIKKFNRENELCYYDSLDLTFKGIDDKSLEVFSKMFLNAGFKVDVYEHQYQGIYDPSMVAKLIEIYPTDEELLRKELLYKNK